MKELTIPYVFDVIFRFLNARIKDKVFGGIFRTYFDIYDKNGLAEDYTANKLISGKKGIPAELRDFYMEEENLSSLVGSNRINTGFIRRCKYFESLNCLNILPFYRCMAGMRNPETVVKSPKKNRPLIIRGMFKNAK